MVLPGVPAPRGADPLGRGRGLPDSGLAGRLQAAQSPMLVPKASSAAWSGLIVMTVPRRSRRVPVRVARGEQVRQRFYDDQHVGSGDEIALVADPIPPSMYWRR